MPCGTRAHQLAPDEARLGLNPSGHRRRLRERHLPGTASGAGGSAALPGCVCSLHGDGPVEGDAELSESAVLSFEGPERLGVAAAREEHALREQSSNCTQEAAEGEGE